MTRTLATQALIGIGLMVWITLLLIPHKLIPNNQAATGNLIHFTSQELQEIRTRIATSCKGEPGSPDSIETHHFQIQTCCSQACADRFEYMRRTACETRCVDAGESLR